MLSLDLLPPNVFVDIVIEIGVFFWHRMYSLRLSLRRLPRFVFTSNRCGGQEVEPQIQIPLRSFSLTPTLTDSPDNLYPVFLPFSDFLLHLLSLILLFCACSFPFSLLSGFYINNNLKFELCCYVKMDISYTIPLGSCYAISEDFQTQLCKKVTSRRNLF